MRTGVRCLGSDFTDVIELGVYPHFFECAEPARQPVVTRIGKVAGTRVPMRTASICCN